MKVLAITQARTGSTRLPNKVLKTIGNNNLLGIHLDRLMKSKKIDQLLVATTIQTEDRVIEEIAKLHGLPSYSGSVQDVLDRFYQAAKKYKPTWVVRLTSDCPLIDPVLIDAIIEKAQLDKLDYFSNTLQPSFPDGEDVEVFTFEALEKAWKEATLPSDREHVTPYIHRNSSFNGKQLFNSGNYSNEKDYGHVRLTVDEEKDFEVIKLLIEKLGTERDWKTYADLYLNDETIKNINKDIKRNEGFKPSAHS